MSTFRVMVNPNTVLSAKITMKPRRTVTLVLLGWYLMTLPTKLNGVDVSAPLSTWTVYKDFDSLKTCSVAEGELHKRAEQDPDVEPPLQFPPKQLQQFAAATCVSSEDSRL